MIVRRRPSAVAAGGGRRAPSWASPHPCEPAAPSVSMALQRAVSCPSRFRSAASSGGLPVQGSGGGWTKAPGPNSRPRPAVLARGLRTVRLEHAGGGSTPATAGSRGHARGRARALRTHRRRPAKARALASPGAGIARLATVPRSPLVPRSSNPPRPPRPWPCGPPDQGSGGGCLKAPEPTSPPRPAAPGSRRRRLPSRLLEACRCGISRLSAPVLAVALVDGRHPSLGHSPGGARISDNRPGHAAAPDIGRSRFASTSRRSHMRSRTRLIRPARRAQAWRSRVGNIGPGCSCGTLPASLSEHRPGWSRASLTSRSSRGRDGHGWTCPG